MAAFKRVGKLGAMNKKGTTFEERLAHALTCDDRQVAAVVWVDPSTETGRTGIAVCAINATGDEPTAIYAYGGPPMSTVTFRWLGETVAAVCGQGERVILGAEQDAYAGVARALGVTVGALEGLLLDLNAVAAGSRVDVQSVTWRNGAGIRARGRPAKKAQALAIAKAGGWVRDDAQHDEAEAACASVWFADEVLRGFSP